MLFQKIRGIKTLLLSLAAFFLVSFVVMKTQVFWLKQLMVIEQLLVVLLVVVIVFASYFTEIVAVEDFRSFVSWKMTYALSIFASEFPLSFK